MWHVLKIVLTIFKIGLFLLAIMLSLANIDDRYNKNKTTTRTSLVDLKDIKFPLKFSILVHPGFDPNLLRTAGYNNPTGYFAGRSMYQDGVFGWAGHSKEGEPISSVSGNLY